MVMQNSELNPQERRKTSSMEDSTAMTIEFLRARLLSERSISRIARQRADELAKKVIELEEQLRMVTLQRKVAEKATADILAILESQGMSDVSDEFEVGSDTENLCESGMSNNSARDGETYMSSKGRQNGSDELSDSDLDSSPIFGRNLRRKNSFSSINSSPKHLSGKSCRKIRHRHTRSLGWEFRDNLMKINCLQKEVVPSSEGFLNGPDRYGGEKDLEMALEHQARLIENYEAMEKSQRDWEDKFRENNVAAPDPCDLGKQSNMAEENDESKVQFPWSAKVANLSAEGDKEEPTDVGSSEEILEAVARDNMPKSFDGTGGDYSNQKSTTFTSARFGQENLHTLVKGNQNESSVNYHSQSSDNKHHQDSGSHGYRDSKQTDCFPIHDYRGLHQNEASRHTNDLYAIVSHEQQSHKFSGVLEALRESRIFLQHHLNNKLPLVETGYTRRQSAPFGKNEDRFDIPVAHPGLFKLPTDFFDEATARFNVHGSTSTFGSNFYLDGGISRTSGAHQLSTSNTTHLQNESRFDSEKHPFVPFNGRTLPSSDKFNYPTFPIYPTYQNTTRKMPFGDETPRPFSSSTVGVPPPRAHDFSFQDHLRSNMYI